MDIPGRVLECERTLMPHVSRVSILLTDFKKEGCYLYIKTNMDLLCKRIKSCIHVEKLHGFQ